jgi:mono/diheme cytochrome c family protein
MKKFIFTSVFILALLSTSCSNDSDDDLAPPPPPQSNDVTYTGTVKAIIDGNCLSCHTNPPVNSAPIS